MPTAFAIAAHPDDIEFFISGTLMRLRDAGYEIHYMNIADGCCGSTTHDAATIAQIRRKEAIAACKHVGAVFHESLCHDLEIFYELVLLKKMTAIIREVAPQIILTLSPQDYMEDHMNATRLAVTAAFARGAPNFETIPPRAAISQKVTIYHAQPYGNVDQVRQPIVPDMYVDVTELIPAKLRMLAEHQSQREWLTQSQGLDSYLVKMEELNAEVGRMSGKFSMAEGFRRHLHLGFCDPTDDPLRKALGKFGHMREE